MHPGVKEGTKIKSDKMSPSAAWLLQRQHIL